MLEYFSCRELLLAGSAPEEPSSTQTTRSSPLLLRDSADAGLPPNRNANGLLDSQERGVEGGRGSCEGISKRICEGKGRSTRMEKGRGICLDTSRNMGSGM